VTPRSLSYTASAMPSRKPAAWRKGGHDRTLSVCRHTHQVSATSPKSGPASASSVRPTTQRIVDLHDLVCWIGRGPHPRAEVAGLVPRAFHLRRPDSCVKYASPARRYSVLWLCGGFLRDPRTIQVSVTARAASKSARCPWVRRSSKGSACSKKHGPGQR
jgi:hypothetical protein